MTEGNVKKSIKKDTAKEVKNILDEKLKLEVAEELGLIEKIKQLGWKGLSAKETGRIGGLITKKKKMLQNKESQQA